MDKNPTHLLEEYKMLRGEIDENIKSFQNIPTFAITAVVALITVAANTKNAYIAMFGFVIILPLVLKEYNLYKTNLRISAYLICFVEPYIDIKWESRNIYRMKKESSTKTKNWIGKLMHIFRHSE